MIEIQNAKINTAGAYVCLNGLYAFAIGIQPNHGRIPVVRIGGHRLAQETGWQCAWREVYEEANLHIHPLTPKTTYLSNGDQIESELQEIQWQYPNEGEYIPLLVTAYDREGGKLLSLMYFAQTAEDPTPSAEVKGILLLEREEVHRLCSEALTLEEYLSSGGRAILNGEFDTHLVLEPFLQLRLLSRILSIESEIKVV